VGSGAGAHSDCFVFVVACGDSNFSMTVKPSDFDDANLHRLQWEGRKMLPKHYFMLLVVLALGYWLGVNYPSLLSKITG
jgi:hypothetical protein